MATPFKTFRALRQHITTRWQTEGEGGLVGYALDLMRDALLQRVYLGHLARFPQQDANGTPGPDDALAALGRDRGVFRGIDESSRSYAYRLTQWLVDARTRGTAFTLMKTLAAYCDWDGSKGCSFRVVDNRGNWFSRSAAGVETRSLNTGNWDWDAEPATKWSRFWVIIYPGTRWVASGASWGGTICDSYATSNQDTQLTLTDASASGAGQSFTGNGSALASATFLLKKFGSPTGNAVAKIYAHSGVFGASSVPTGAALATSDAFSVSTLTTSYVATSLTFSGANKIALASGTKYVLTIEYSGGTVGVNALNIGADSSAPTHAGNVSTFGVSWTASATYDMCFTVFTTAPTWGGSTTWGGTTITDEQSRTLRAIVADQKPDGTRCHTIILALDPASFSPAAPEPNGTWQYWANRLTTALYLDGN